VRPLLRFYFNFFPTCSVFGVFGVSICTFVLVKQSNAPAAYVCTSKHSYFCTSTAVTAAAAAARTCLQRLQHLQHLVPQCLRCSCYCFTSTKVQMLAAAPAAPRPPVLPLLTCELKLLRSMCTFVLVFKARTCLQHLQHLARLVPQCLQHK
jgi:hypothetical protein